MLALGIDDDDDDDEARLLSIESWSIHTWHPFTHHLRARWRWRLTSFFDRVLELRPETEDVQSTLMLTSPPYLLLLLTTPHSSYYSGDH